jgi:multicomponent Na+:H+ antiporter subunit E
MLITLVEHRVPHFVAACGLWWVLSGRSDWLTLSLGLGSAAFSVYLAKRMLAVDREAQPFVIGRKLLAYWCWLALAIVKSNLDVMRHIFRVPLQITPTWTWVHTDPKTEVGMATLANSITLTPGTVSVDVDMGSRSIAVHALTQDAAEYLQTGDMERRAGDPGRVQIGD